MPTCSGTLSGISAPDPRVGSCKPPAGTGGVARTHTMEPRTTGVMRCEVNEVLGPTHQHNLEVS